MPEREGKYGEMKLPSVMSTSWKLLEMPKWPIAVVWSFFFCSMISSIELSLSGDAVRHRAEGIGQSVEGKGRVTCK